MVEDIVELNIDDDGTQLKSLSGDLKDVNDMLVPGVELKLLNPLKQWQDHIMQDTWPERINLLMLWQYGKLKFK